MQVIVECLFVFVVMLLDLKGGEGSDTGSGISTLAAGATVWFFSLLLLRAFNRASFFSSADTPVAQYIKAVSMLLFTKYLWAFELLSVFLLALIVSVCVLARADKREREERRRLEA